MQQDKESLSSKMLKDKKPLQLELLLAEVFMNEDDVFSAFLPRIWMLHIEGVVASSDPP